MTQTNIAELPNIGSPQIRRIAKSSNSSVRYVQMVLSGDRNSNSTKSKAIMRGAIMLNKKIEAAQQTVDRKIENEID